jgi:hypothetical protein
MAITYLENGDVYDAYQMTHPEKGIFKFGSALVMNREQYETMTPEEIQKIKEERYYDWYNQLIAASSIAVDNSVIESDYVVIDESANTEII